MGGCFLVGNDCVFMVSVMSLAEMGRWLEGDGREGGGRVSWMEMMM